MIENLERVGLLIDPPGFGPREITVDGTRAIDRKTLAGRWNSADDIVFVAWSNFSEWERASISSMKGGRMIVIDLDGLGFTDIKRVAELIVGVAMESAATVGVAGALGLEDYLYDWALYFERETLPAPQEFDILFDPRRSPTPLLGGRFTR